MRPLWCDTGLVPELRDTGRSRRPSQPTRSTAAAGLVAVLVSLLTACAQVPPAQLGLTDLIARPAERTLLLGLRAYDDGQYSDAERLFDSALRAGLLTGKDRAATYKHLAFIYCTTDRIQPCEEAFVSARRADAAFALSRSESGHPQWGPVYRRVLP